MKNYRIIQIGIVFACQLGLVGCIGIESRIKAYDGPDRPLNEKVLLKPAQYMDIVHIDGRDDTRTSTTWFLGHREIEFELDPGPHGVEVFYSSVGVTALISVRVNFDGKAGHKYLLYNASKDYRKWKPVIIDVTDRDDLWCAKCGSKL